MLSLSQLTLQRHSRMAKALPSRLRILTELSSMPQDGPVLILEPVQIRLGRFAWLPKSHRLICYNLRCRIMILKLRLIAITPRRLKPLLLTQRLLEQHSAR